MAWSPKDPPRYGGLKIDGVPPFQGSIEFTFDPKVNVFIGPNATGKSTILKVLYPEFQELHDLQRLNADLPPVPGEFNIELVGDWLEHDFVPGSEDPHDPVLIQEGRKSREARPLPHPLQGEVNPATVPLIYLPPIRDVAPILIEDYDSNDSRPENRYKSFYENVGLIYAYDLEKEAFYNSHEVATLEALLAWLKKNSSWDFEGQERRIREATRFIGPGVSSLQGLGLDAYPFTRFDCNRVYYALQKLRAEDESGTGSGWDAKDVAEATHACLRDICPEVIQGDPASITSRKPIGDGRQYSDHEFNFKKVENFGMGAHTPDSKDAPLYVGDLSTGTQGLFWWICYLAIKLAWHYLFYREPGHPTAWQHLPAILLIDEIENHLHPTWQRRVIPALRKHFPGLQIFATTHSPFVVAGLKRGQVHRLYREKGVIKTDQLTEEEKERKLVGWTVEQILRKFMDVTDPTDEETAMAAATLRWLQGRQPPPDVSAAVWVQECIQHLQDNHERDENETAALVWLAGRQQTERQQKEGDALATKKAVEWRAEVLGELRTMVSLDIEAGGPFAAQRERFTAQLRKLLAKDQTGSQDPEEEG